MSVAEAKSGSCCAVPSGEVSGSCSPAAGAKAPVSEETRYKGLLSYIVSNAVAGEIMAIENYGEMITALDDTDEKIVTAKQVYDESKHVALLAKLGQRGNYEVKKKIVEPQWLKIRQHFSEAVRNRDAVTCYLMQDLMTETLAIVLYRVLTRNTDEVTRTTADNILRDELRHLDIGINRVKGMLQADPEGVHQKLVAAHNKVIPELFSMISYSCHSLCGDLNVDCGILGLDSIKTDLDDVHALASETYVETLERCEFEPKVTMPLIANIP